MLRTVVCAALFLSLATPVLADAKADAIAACAQWIKRDGIAIGVFPDYAASGSGERFDVTTRATVEGRANSPVTCKVNKGRVTHISYG